MCVATAVSTAVRTSAVLISGNDVCQCEHSDNSAFSVAACSVAACSVVAMACMVCVRVFTGTTLRTTSDTTADSFRTNLVEGRLVAAKQFKHSHSLLHSVWSEVGSFPLSILSLNKKENEKEEHVLKPLAGGLQ